MRFEMEESYTHQLILTRCIASFYPEIGNAVDRARFCAEALELEGTLATLRNLLLYQPVASQLERNLV